MARKRDIVIAIIIAGSFIITIGFFGLMFIGLMGEGGEVSFGGFGSRIAVIEVFGNIIDSESVVRQLKKWGESGNVRAIVLHIDSPGGGVAPSQEIYNEILRVRSEDEKVVVASMSSVAASGGYLIACACDKIMANPGTITGSIGVILQFPTLGELFNKIGIAYETVKSGELKDVGSMDRRMTAEERRMLSAMVEDTYEQFVEVVAEGREMEIDYVRKYADGSVFSGRQALEIGLIDALGGFEDAVRLAGEMVGIEGEPETIKEIKPRRGFWDILGGVSEEIENITSGEGHGPRIMYLY